MRTLANRVARLERQRADVPIVPCRRCSGKYFGVEFIHPAPGDYDAGPPGSPEPPDPPNCPECGREMEKIWRWPDRASWVGV